MLTQKYNFFILVGNKDNHKRLNEVEFGQLTAPIMEFAALEHLTN